MSPSKASRSAGALALLCSCTANIFLSAPASAEQVIFSEVHFNPPTGQPEFIEVYNNTATPFDMGKWYFSNGIEFTFPDFSSGDSHILKSFERILVSDVDEATLRAAYSIPAGTRIFGPYTGALSNGGETVALSDKNGVIMTELSYNDGGKWPAAPDGTGHTLTRINPNLSQGEWRNWKSSDLPGGTPGTAPLSDGDLPTTTTQIVQTNSIWKYDQNIGNVDLGSAWREPAYDDNAWLEGAGIFGRNSNDVFATPWTIGGRATYYLRREFQQDEAFSSASIDIEANLDDGVVVYLNGQEIARFNMPAGVINFETLALDGREWDDELAEVASDNDISGALKVGTNVLAVEVHNEAFGSSDIAFGANMNITAASLPAGAPPNVVISEVHFAPDDRVDWVELHAPGQAAVDAGALSIASLTDLSDATPLAGSVPAGGYLSFPVDLAVAANGNINLYLALGSRVLDAQKLDRDLGEESFQSLPVGKEFFGGPGHTQNEANNPSARITDIVINEIMFDAPSDHGNAEFIELFNRGAATVDLSNWRFTDGIGFDFPPGTSLASGAYLVIAADAACITSAHGGIPVLGDWSGTLRDGGELIRLEDSNGNLADEVDYKPAGDWPNLADGDGSSMELRHPDMDNNVATAWIDSDESGKTSMQNFTYTAFFDRASWSPISGAQELHVNLVGDAHVIIGNVSLKRDNSGSNIINNPGSMSPNNSSASGWVTQGTHWASFMDGGQLNLIADGHGDNKGNQAQVDIGALSFDQSYTLSFDARWVSGKSRIIFQTLDHGFGTSFLLPIPENLGTPGAANGELIPSPAPTLSGLIHSPAVPKPNGSVKVSARVDSSDPIASVKAFYREDSATNGPTSPAADWKQAEMTSDGAGLYSASLNQFNENKDIVQFYVEAQSTTGEITRMPRFIDNPPTNNPLVNPPVPGPARPAMWVVDQRDMFEASSGGGSLMRERFVVSEYDRRALTLGTGHSPTFNYNFPKMSNHFFNATFIANESEIYYNAEIRKSGSPFTREPSSDLRHGKWKLPGDRLFRGRRRSVFDASGTSQGSGTPRFWDDRIARYFLYQLGHPINEFEFVHWVVNTDTFRLRENHEPISNDMLDRNFPGGADGTLLRIDDEWRFTSDNGTSTSARDADWSYKDSENAIQYQTEWIMRSRESDHDFDNFIEWVRTLDDNNFDEATIDRIADADMLCINAAVRGYDADWDTITVNRGKNAYFFRPKEGKGWMLLHWDGDRVFANTGQAIIGGRPGVRTYFDKPYIKRRLNYYLTKLLDDHAVGTAGSRTRAWMDAEEASVSGSHIDTGGSGVSTRAAATMNHYRSWFTGSRRSFTRNYVNSTSNATFTITTSNAATPDDNLDLDGTAPPNIFALRVFAKNPDDTREPLDARFRWINQNDWELTGIHLRSGVNELIIEGIDHEGNHVDELAFNITKTSNAPPVVNIDPSPKSKNVSLGETLMLDANGSYDPEGASLSFAWQVSPSTGVNLVPVGAAATATFTQPGLYTFTATATDDQPQNTASSIGIAVYGPESFSTFGSDTLEDFWSYFNVEKHGNASGTPHFSLQDNPGRLTLNIPVSLTPLGLPQEPLPTAQMYVDFGDIWKYDDSNVDLIATFAEPAFDDALWQQGPGFLGFNQSGLPAPGLQTDSLRKDGPNNLITYYFRTEFEFSDDPVGSQLSFDQIVDDGVRYYLNGHELGTVRLPEPITHFSRADSLPNENVIEEAVLEVDGSSSLVSGTNVLAAEVHNVSPGSSDLVFGARLNIAANPVGNGEIDLDDVIHPWIHRPLPATEDWTLQTEVKLERAQFGYFFAGLLVESEAGGNAFRYGIGFKDGNSIAALRVNPSGTSEILNSMPAVATDIAIVRLQRVGDQLLFTWDGGDGFTTIHQITLPTGFSATFSRGGIFASTEANPDIDPDIQIDMGQSLEASFDYTMLIDSTPASTIPLIVSEIMYHPVSSSALEFIELYNAGAAPIELGGFKTVGTEPFDQFTFPAYTLQPGSYALLVSNAASFSAEYGDVPPVQIIGQWPGGNLNNAGELITLVDASGALITSFTYDDNAPWPITPDGMGPSLVINDETAGLDPNIGTNWRASTALGGSPGSPDGPLQSFDDWMADNGFVDPNAEYFGSGYSNLLAYALGRDLAIDVAPIIGDSGGFTAFSHRQRLGDNSLTYAAESSTDLANWFPAGDLMQDGPPASNGDGTVTVRLLSNLPTSGRVDTYYRLKVTAP